MNDLLGLGAPTLLHLYGSSLLILFIWSAFWKGLALWHSAQRDQYYWFIIFVIINTAGILEIIYLFGVAKLTFDKLFTSRMGSHTH